MPSSGGKDDEVFVKLFVSAYENFAWRDSEIRWLDQHVDGAVEALVTRPDGKTMAIEHTLIEPFVGEKRDFAMFEKALVGIECDTTLAVPNCATYVYVPVGVLDGQKPEMRRVIVDAVHQWIKTNRLQIRDGIHEYPCQVPGSAATSSFTITLTVRRSQFHRPSPGALKIWRQQIVNDLDKVIEKAFTKKLPKLSNTKADRHILFLERDQFPFDPQRILDEIERQRAHFPLLEGVDEIWIVNTPLDKNYVDFELTVGQQHLASLTFQHGTLIGHSKDGMPYPM